MELSLMWHSCSMFFLAKLWCCCSRFQMKSRVYPATTARITFTSSSFQMTGNALRWERSTGRASSEVERNTATSVPAVTMPPLKRWAQDTLNPH